MEKIKTVYTTFGDIAPQKDYWELTVIILVTSGFWVFV